MAGLACRSAVAPHAGCRASLAPPAATKTAHHTAITPATSMAGQAHQQPQWRRQRQQAAGQRDLRAQSIGFDLPGAESDNKSAEKHAEELTRGAASLLLYSGVLKGKPAQAFLGVLQLLQKGNLLMLTQQYSEFYRLLALDEYASWGDYLVDQIIRGTDSPLARAAAAGKSTAHLRVAAAHDLDVLQQMAVLERTLAGWVKVTGYGVSEQWLEAASSLAPAADGQPQPEAVHEALLAQSKPLPGLVAPLTEAQRAGLRAELAGKWRWSEGVQLLERYHAAHGYGLVSSHGVLAWTGKLQAQDGLKGAHELKAAEEAGRVGADHSAGATLVQALTQFLQQDPTGTGNPPHIAVCGSPADRWLFTSWALQRLQQQVPAELAAQAAGIRTLVLPSSQLGSLADLAWSLGQYPRARFAVVVNGLGGSGGAGAADVAAILSGYDGFSWPSNTLLLAGFPDAPPEDLAPVFRHTAVVERRAMA